MATAEGNATVSAALFGKFKTDVADQFTKDDAVKVAVCLNLKPAKRGEIKSARNPGLVLLKYLQGEDIIREDNIERLCDALAHCHLNRTARITKEEFEKYKSKKERGGDGEPPSPGGSYDPGTLRGILQDDLTRGDCFELAIYFSLPDQVVNTVQESKIYANELLDTLENRTIISKGNISALLIALKDRGLQRVVNKIKAAYEQKHIVTCEDDRPATHEEGSGDSMKCQICAESTFDDLKYEDELVARLCKNEDCLAKYVVTPTSSPNDMVTIKQGNQVFLYKPPRRLDLSKMKYEEVTDIKDLKPGDHIVFRRSIFYDHHAILVSITESQKLTVIHWTSESVSNWVLSLFKSNTDSIISIKNEEKYFPRGGVKRVVYDKEDPEKLVLARAFQMFKSKDKQSYSLAGNNCESLATYCKSGVFYSVQGQFLNKYRPFMQKLIN